MEHINAASNRETSKVIVWKHKSIVYHKLMKVKNCGCERYLGKLA